MEYEESVLVDHGLEGGDLELAVLHYLSPMGVSGVRMITQGRFAGHHTSLQDTSKERILPCTSRAGHSP